LVLVVHELVSHSVLQWFSRARDISSAGHCVRLGLVSLA
jgi:hypothetical protein